MELFNSEDYSRDEMRFLAGVGVDAARELADDHFFASTDLLPDEPSSGASIFDVDEEERISRVGTLIRELTQERVDDTASPSEEVLLGRTLTTIPDEFFTDSIKELDHVSLFKKRGDPVRKLAKAEIYLLMCRRALAKNHNMTRESRTRFEFRIDTLQSEIASCQALLDAESALASKMIPALKDRVKQTAEIIRLHPAVPEDLLHRPINLERSLIEFELITEHNVNPRYVSLERCLIRFEISGPSEMLAPAHFSAIKDTAVAAVRPLRDKLVRKIEALDNLIDASISGGNMSEARARALHKAHGHLLTDYSNICAEAMKIATVSALLMSDALVADREAWRQHRMICLSEVVKGTLTLVGAGVRLGFTAGTDVAAWYSGVSTVVAFYRLYVEHTRSVESLFETLHKQITTLIELQRRAGSTEQLGALFTVTEASGNLAGALVRVLGGSATDAASILPSTNGAVDTIRVLRHHMERARIHIESAIAAVQKDRQTYRVGQKSAQQFSPTELDTLTSLLGRLDADQQALLNMLTEMDLKIVRLEGQLQRYVLFGAQYENFITQQAAGQNDSGRDDDASTIAIGTLQSAYESIAGILDDAGVAELPTGMTDVVGGIGGLLQMV